MTAAELIERIKDNPDGQVLVRDSRGGLLPIAEVDEPYRGATVIKVGQVTVTTHEG